MSKQFIDIIINLFNNSKSSLKLLEIAKSLNIKENSQKYQALIEELDLLVEQDLLTRTQNNTYSLSNISKVESRLYFENNKNIFDASVPSLAEVDIDFFDTIMAFYEINPTAYLTQESNEYLRIETDTPKHKSFIKHLDLLADEYILNRTYQDRYYLSHKSNINQLVSELKEKYAKTESQDLSASSDSSFDIKAGIIDAVMNVFKNNASDLKINDIAQLLNIKISSNKHKALLFHIRLLKEQGVLNKKSNGKYYLVKQPDTESKMNEIKSIGKKRSAKPSSVATVSQEPDFTNDWFARSILNVFKYNKLPLKIETIAEQLDIKPFSKEAADLSAKLSSLVECGQLLKTENQAYFTKQVGANANAVIQPIRRKPGENFVNGVINFFKNNQGEFDINAICDALHIKADGPLWPVIKGCVHRLNEYGILRKRGENLFSLIATLNAEDMPEFNTIIEETKQTRLVFTNKPFPDSSRPALFNDIFNLLANSLKTMYAYTISDALGIVVSSAGYWVLLQHLNLLISRGVVGKTIAGGYYLTKQASKSATYAEAAEAIAEVDLPLNNTTDNNATAVKHSQPPVIKEDYEILPPANLEEDTAEQLQEKILHIIKNIQPKIKLPEIAKMLDIALLSPAYQLLSKQIKALVEEDILDKDIKKYYYLCNRAKNNKIILTNEQIRHDILNVLKANPGTFKLADIRYELNIKENSPAYQPFLEQINVLLSQNILFKDNYKNYGLNRKQLNQSKTIEQPDTSKPEETENPTETLSEQILELFMKYNVPLTLRGIQKQLNIPASSPLLESLIAQLQQMTDNGTLQKHKWNKYSLPTTSDAKDIPLYNYEEPQNIDTFADNNTTPSNTNKTYSLAKKANFTEEPTSNIIPNIPPPNNMNNDILDQIINLFKDNSDTLQLLQISKALNIKSESEEYIALVEKLNLLVEQNILEKKSRRRYALATPTQDYGLVGIYKVDGKRKLVETQSDVFPVVYIKGNQSLNAKNGDKVKCRVTKSSALKNSTSLRDQGEIIEILEHSQNEVAGYISYEDGNYYLIPDEPDTEDFRIPTDMLHGARNGDKVLCEIVAWNDGKNSCPLAKVKTITGKQGDPSDMYRSIINEFHLPLQFPTNVEKEAASITAPVNRKVAGRLDLRKERIITIDPSTAKDFDDALSLITLPNGNWRLGVHIADVSHYVKEGSAIDIEAQKRGNSVYLVDRVIPMLPESLSNDICSLNPDTVRYTYSVLIDIDPEYKTVGYEIIPSMIQSCRRFTYDEVQDIIDTENGDERDLILSLYKLTKQLKKQRINAGSINFYNREVKYILDDTFVPVDVELHEPTEATSLVEECMLLANQMVALYLKVLSKQYNSQTGNSNLLPFIYRVHEKPMQERLQAAIANMQASGIRYKTKEVTPAVINSILKQVDNTPFKELINNFFIMAMTRAVYSTNNTGHFGLNFTDYTQFTSPIRRYSDLLVHRLLKEYDAGNYKPARINRLHKELPAIAAHISITEKEATSAERASTKLAATIFAQNKLGEIFDGTISGVSDKGIFVTLDDIYCEGFVRCRALLPKDDYKFEFKAMKLVGKKTKQVYIIGMRVRVLVKNVNIVKREIVLEMVEEEEY